MVATRERESVSLRHGQERNGGIRRTGHLEGQRRAGAAERERRRGESRRLNATDRHERGPIGNGHAAGVVKRSQGQAAGVDLHSPRERVAAVERDEPSTILHERTVTGEDARNGERARAVEFERAASLDGHRAGEAARSGPIAHPENAASDGRTTDERVLSLEGGCAGARLHEPARAGDSTVSGETIVAGRTVDRGDLGGDWGRDGYRNQARAGGRVVEDNPVGVDEVGGSAIGRKLPILGAAGIDPRARVPGTREIAFPDERIDRVGDAEVGPPVDVGVATGADLPAIRRGVRTKDESVIGGRTGEPGLDISCDIEPGLLVLLHRRDRCRWGLDIIGAGHGACIPICGVGAGRVPRVIHAVDRVGARRLTIATVIRGEHQPALGDLGPGWHLGGTGAKDAVEFHQCQHVGTASVTRGRATGGTIDVEVGCVGLVDCGSTDTVHRDHCHPGIPADARHE